MLTYPYYHIGPDLPSKKVETKGGLTIELLYDHQFAFVGNSLFHLQVCKFNGYLQYGLSKFFQPKNGIVLRSDAFSRVDQDENPFSGKPFTRMSEEEKPFFGLPTKSNCWMSPKTWSDFIDCVEQTTDRLAKKNIQMGMHPEIFVNIVLFYKITKALSLDISFSIKNRSKSHVHTVDLFKGDKENPIDRSFYARELTGFALNFEGKAILRDFNFAPYESYLMPFLANRWAESMLSLLLCLYSFQFFLL